MKSVQRSIVLALFAAVAPIGASVAWCEETSVQKIDRKTEDAVTTVKSAIFDALDKSDLVVTFENDNSILSAGEKRNLDAFVKSLDSNSKTLKLVVAGWSDQAYPIERGTKLSNGDESLASRRAAHVVAYLKSIRTFAHVESFNMAKQSSFFSRAFGTDDARIKEELAGQHGKDFEMAYIASVLREKGKVSSVVTMVYNRDRAVSH